MQYYYKIDGNNCFIIDYDPESRIATAPIMQARLFAQESDAAHAPEQPTAQNNDITLQFTIIGSAIFGVISIGGISAFLLTSAGVFSLCVAAASGVASVLLGSYSLYKYMSDGASNTEDVIVSNGTAVSERVALAL